ncbi:protein SnodProt1 precursor [Trichoderma gamsii]|uniref:Protein SnodProt1 n=1 Tax=Trichoderma gamsii TaxID=398673 RepID=A0A2P4ZG29_9HYPO|nr:protein SnodProt1 precursor [Trichoderma gamsii]PON23246.1 protein SnodProt1 precursor [Trichoderma gamsii]
MRVSNIFTAATLVTAITATYVSFDPGYDDASKSLRGVSCSDGLNGLITKYHWETQGQISRFPYIGGVQGTTWNSTSCGACYKLEFAGRSIHVLGIDAAYNGGLNIGLHALNDLTNGNAVAWGHVDATVTQVSGRDCGLPNAHKAN